MMKKPLIITFGDPGGISPEILIKTLTDKFINPDDEQYIKETTQRDKYCTIIIGSIHSFLTNWKSIFDFVTFSPTDDYPDYKIKLLKLLNFIFLIKKFEQLPEITDSNRGYLFFYDPILEKTDNNPEEPIGEEQSHNFSDFYTISTNKMVFPEFSLKNNFFLQLLSPYQKKAIKKFKLEEKKIEEIYGKVDPLNGFMAELYLSLSVKLIKFLLGMSIIPSLITLPVNKKAISFIVPKFIGHTEYYSASFHCKHTTMILYSKPITVALVSTHIPLKKIKSSINKKRFFITLNNSINFYNQLEFKNGIGVLAPNPHASDQGLIGNDEKWIEKAIKETRKGFPEIYGPISADTAFTGYSGNRHSLYISFYHDQGLIPFKILSSGAGVNITFGLPFLRISPDHGTGFDITLSNRAKNDSLIQCLNMINSSKQI